MFLLSSSLRKSLRILFCALVFVSLGAGSVASDDQSASEEKKPGAENKAKDEKKEGAESKANAKDADKDAFTFVQITDSHIFDSGKERKGQTPQELRMNKVEFTDSREAWEWSLREINQLALKPGAVDFVVFTGDFGLERVTTDDPPPYGCVTRESAVDDVARAFASLLVDKVYVVRGNNDLDEEQTEDVGRFDDFVERVAKNKRFPRKTNLDVVNLTPANVLLPPNATPPRNKVPGVDTVKGVRIVGLDSSAFKLTPRKKNTDCPYSVPRNITLGYQKVELQRVASIEQDMDTPLILFTHVPDLEDPFTKQSAWQVGQGERNEWNKIVVDHRLLAVFAGHLHDSVRSHYLPPYSWQANRGARLNQVYEKTYLAPPLAPKFQMDASPQARGYLLVAMTPQGVKRAEIRWYPGNIGDVIIASPPAANRDGHIRWKRCALWIAMGIVLLLVLAALAYLLLRKRKGDTQAGAGDAVAEAFAEPDSVQLFALVAGSALLSLLLVAIAKMTLGIGESATLIALMLIPLLVYGVASGKLKNLKAPGGWEATFQQVGAQTVDVKAVVVEDSVTVQKLGVVDTLQQFARMTPGKPVLLTLQLHGGGYDVTALRDILQKATQFPDFRFVVILDQEGKVVGYAPVNKFKVEFARDDNRAQGLLTAVNMGNTAEVREFPGVLPADETVSNKTSNAEALERMQKLGLDAILAVDKEGKPIGVVERQHIINQMVTQLAKRANE